MEPDNYEQTSGRRDRLENKYAELMPLGTLAEWETAVQLAGIHDALIRLEATVRMIGVNLQETLSSLDNSSVLSDIAENTHRGPGE